jgi:hypothetical protein
VTKKVMTAVSMLLPQFVWAAWTAVVARPISNVKTVSMMESAQTCSVTLNQGFVLAVKSGPMTAVMPMVTARSVGRTINVAGAMRVPPVNAMMATSASSVAA